MAAADLEEFTPEEASKRIVAWEYEMLAAEADHFGWDVRLDDRDDFYVVYVRLPKPEGRTFVLRLECDDYPRQAPLAKFINPDGWNDVHHKDEVEAKFFPAGASYLSHDRGTGYPVMCIRGHRDYYSGPWHSGWTNPPHRDDTISRFVVNVRNAILDIWT